MNREERAKQFMPFAALKGYAEALREQEEIYTERKERSEEYEERISFHLSQIRKHDMISVVYFQQGEYCQKRGRISGIDFQNRVLEIEGTTIHFKDLYKLIPYR